MAIDPPKGKPALSVCPVDSHVKIAASYGNSGIGMLVRLRTCAYQSPVQCPRVEDHKDGESMMLNQSISDHGKVYIKFTLAYCLRIEVLI